MVLVQHICSRLSVVYLTFFIWPNYCPKQLIQLLIMSALWLYSMKIKTSFWILECKSTSMFQRFTVSSTTACQFIYLAQLITITLTDRAALYQLHKEHLLCNKL